MFAALPPVPHLPRNVERITTIPDIDIIQIVVRHDTRARVPALDTQAPFGLDGAGLEVLPRILVLRAVDIQGADFSVGRAILDEDLQL